ncbi:hypothetical protein [Luteibacter sp. SG786]|uniref:hypothetical protein n=1 Tax=Luteibacter sp. SG786 TaxID=2587130 RepID=UPI00141E47B0|nr:hypothetical protein [Luteibacter sp. SG786]NII55391.1 hypothetical protein [Luteibacter sp. SG786]
MTSSLKRGYDILWDRLREGQLGQLGINVAMSRSPIIKTEAPSVTLLEAIGGVMLAAGLDARLIAVAVAVEVIGISGPDLAVGRPWH